MIREAIKSDIDAINKLIYDSNNQKTCDLLKGDMLSHTIKRVFIYEENKEVIGFILINDLKEEIEIIDFIICKEYRGKKIGSKLLNYIINNFTSSIFLEVNVNNEPAINLYKKYNFEIINIRNNYYNDEDAYIMRRLK